MKQFDIILPRRRVEADVIIQNAKDRVNITAKNAIYVHEGELYTPDMENEIYVKSASSVLSSAIHVNGRLVNAVALRDNIKSVYSIYVYGEDGDEIFVRQKDANLSVVRYRYVHEMDGGYLYLYDGELLTALDKTLEEMDGYRWSVYDQMTLSELDYISST